MAGAVETMYAESAQALFCAIADIAGKQKTKKNIRRKFISFIQ